MRDKYNLNTLPVGIAGLEDMDLASMYIYFQVQVF